MKFAANIVLLLLVITSTEAALRDYKNPRYFDTYNPPPEDFNPDYIGRSSNGDRNPNALQFSGGASVGVTPLYDNYGNQLTKNGRKVVTKSKEVGYYNGRHNGKIHAGAIARIKINGRTENMIYLSAVDVDGPGTYSGWAKVSAMSPAGKTWDLSREVNSRRESSKVRYTANSGGRNRYDRMEVENCQVPSSMRDGYIIPNRSSSAGKVEYYYIRDGVLNGFINLPETGNKRHGVQGSRVRVGESFWRDKDVDDYIQDIYGRNSSRKIGSFRFTFGYFKTNGGTKIYSWTNRECLTN